MESVIRGIIVYIFLLAVFRVVGRRTLNDATLFDLVLIFIISETVQQALLGDDFSITNVVVVVLTLVVLDVGFSFLKRSSAKVEQVLEGRALIVLENGQCLNERMRKARINDEDILLAARQQGLSRLSQIKYAILEKDGTISIIPQDVEK